MMTIESDLINYLNTEVMVVLKPQQLSILNQVFRPIFIGTVQDIGNGCVLLTKVNIKMNQAPEYVFPTPLIIPINKIAWFMPFDSSIRFSIF